MKINKTAREKERFEGGSGFKATMAGSVGGWRCGRVDRIGVVEREEPGTILHSI